MNRKRAALFLMLSISLLAVFASGCGPDAAALEATVAREVAAAVTGTVGALPASTSLPTGTPLATYTARPPDTPQPTLTDRPTLTPRPTYTVPPTDTPSPTATATQTPAAVTGGGGAAPPPPPAPAASALADEVRQTIVQMETYRGLLPPYCAVFVGGSCQELRNVADCAAVVGTYDGILQSYALPAGASAAEQAAFSQYLTAKGSFIAEAGWFGENCRAALASGESVGMDTEVRNLLVLTINNILNTLYQAEQSLGGS
jgi:hypothetical protein